MTYLSKELREAVAERAKKRCEYCQTQPQMVIDMAVDRVEPSSRGGETVFDNLALACSICNRVKQAFHSGIDPDTQIEVPLYNPRQQTWSAHFTWDEANTRIVGLTAVGRATVARLHLNREDRVAARQVWVSVGWHPPVLD
jgi:hypothetical protein